jgi:hypothetical protein
MTLRERRASDFKRYSDTPLSQSQQVLKLLKRSRHTDSMMPRNTVVGAADNQPQVAAIFIAPDH